MKCLFCQNEIKLSFDGFSHYVKCENCGASGPREEGEDKASRKYQIELKPSKSERTDILNKMTSISYDTIHLYDKTYRIQAEITLSNLTPAEMSELQQYILERKNK